MEYSMSRRAYSIEVAKLAGGILGLVKCVHYLVLNPSSECTIDFY